MKSTLAAMLISWASVFFPKNNAIILNMKKDAGTANIERVCAVLESLPKWMFGGGSPYVRGGKLITELRLSNASKIKVMYPAKSGPIYRNIYA